MTTRASTLPLLSGLSLLLALGCTPGGPSMTSDSSTGDETMASAGSSGVGGSTNASTGMGTSTGAGSTAAAGTTAADATETTGVGSTGETTAGGEPIECWPYEPDCPEGMKCAWTATPESDFNFESGRCVPVVGDGQLGDPCVVEEFWHSGQDDCAEGYQCFADFETLAGVCLESCLADDVEEFVCAVSGEGLCFETGSSPAVFCYKPCDPVAQDCPGESMGCFGDPDQDVFICTPPALLDGLDGAQGAPCLFTENCASGHYCAPEADVGCGADGCCTAYCDLNQAPDPCPGELACAPFFADPAPGNEHVGVCALP